MKNRLKERLRNGELLIGTLVGLGHPDITEILAGLGFDWLFLDAEHSPMTFETLQQLIQTVSNTNCTPIVRPQWNDPVQIKRILDIGAYGVLVPWVNTQEEAEDAVRACKYPPDGIRGFGPRRAARFDPDYFKTANEEILVVVMIETKIGLNNLEEILSVPGVDACFIGPYDLSCNLGFGVPPKWDNSEYLAAIDRIIDVSQKYNKPAGIYATLDIIEWVIEKGFTFIAVGDADSFLIHGAKIALSKARGNVKR